MEKQFVLEPRDILRFSWFVMVSRNPLRGFFLLFAMTMITLSFIGRLFLMKGWDDVTQGPFLYVTVLFVLTIITIVATFRGAYKADGIRGNYRIVLLPEGVLYQAPKIQSLIYWNTIQKFHMTKQYVYLMVSANRGVIVPRRVFDSLEEEETYIGQIQESFNRYQQHPQTQQTEQNQQSQQMPIMQQKPFMPQTYNRPTFKYKIQLGMVFFILFLIVVGVINFMTGLHGK